MCSIVFSAASQRCLDMSPERLTARCSSRFSRITSALLLAGAAMLCVTMVGDTQAVAQTASRPAPVGLEERPPPPTEPSIPNPEKSPAAKGKGALQAAPAPPVRKYAGPGKLPTGPVAMPPPEVLMMMLRNAMAAVNQANYTENYTVLHGLMTPAVQARVGPAQLARAFASLRKQKIDLSASFVQQPQLTAPASISPTAELRLAGYFPTQPIQINFSISWLPIDNRWLIDTLSVSTTQVPAPGAPAAAAQPDAVRNTAETRGPAASGGKSPPQQTRQEPPARTK